jgi:hypothetical protein
VLLAGHRELSDAIRTAGIEPGVAWHLRPLTADEAPEYVAHRMREAGALSGLLSAATIDTICRESGGIPQEINRLCEEAIAEMRSARSRRRRKTVDEWLESGQEPREAWWRRRWGLALGAAVLLVAVAGAGVIAFRQVAPDRPAVVQSPAVETPGSEPPVGTAQVAEPPAAEPPASQPPVSNPPSTEPAVRTPPAGSASTGKPPASMAPATAITPAVEAPRPTAAAPVPRPAPPAARTTAGSLLDDVRAVQPPARPPASSPGNARPSAPVVERAAVVRAPAPVEPSDPAGPPSRPAPATDTSVRPDTGDDPAAIIDWLLGDGRPRPQLPLE